MSRVRLRLRGLLAERDRANATLARAIAKRADPWYIEECRLRLAELNERALEAEFKHDPALGAGLRR